jgi:hypothetical protein
MHTSCGNVFLSPPLFHVDVKSFEHSGEDVKDGFPGRTAGALAGKHDQPGRGPEPFISQFAKRFQIAAAVPLLRS